MRKILAVLAITLLWTGGSTNSWAAPAACCDPVGQCTNGNGMGCSCPTGTAFCFTGPCSQLTICECLIDGEYYCVDSACAAMCENRIALETPPQSPAACNPLIGGPVASKQPIVFWIGLPL